MVREGKPINGSWETLFRGACGDHPDLIFRKKRTGLNSQSGSLSHEKATIRQPKALKKPLSSFSLQVYFCSREEKERKNLEIVHEAERATLLIGPLPDQAPLYGVLLTIRRLGLNLPSLEASEASTREEPGEPG